MDPEVVRYIARYRTVYTREAIRKNLVDAAHSPQEVDAAFKAVERGEVPEPPTGEPPYELPTTSGQDVVGSDAGERSAISSPRFWLGFLGLILVSYGVPFLFVMLASNYAGYAVLVFPAALIVGLVAMLVLMGRDRPLALGLASGLLTAFLIPFVLVIILAGICVFGGPSGLSG